jgi:hypothetical protein
MKPNYSEASGSYGNEYERSCAEVYCVVWFWRFRGTYCLLLMEAVRKNLQLNQLTSSIKSSWLTIVKSTALTGLTSRYLSIILMVVYSTRRLHIKSVCLIKDNWMINLFIQLCFTLDSHYLAICCLELNLAKTLSLLDSPLAHQLFWTSFWLVRPTPRYSHNISLAAYSLSDGDSEHLWNAGKFLPGYKCSDLKDWLSRLKLFSVHF